MDGSFSFLDSEATLRLQPLRIILRDNQETLGLRDNKYPDFWESSGNNKLEMSYISRLDCPDAKLTLRVRLTQMTFGYLCISHGNVVNCKHLPCALNAT